jgi:hypothetical protein
VIKYNLICDSEHEFEAWFDNIQSYETQSDAGHLNCPICHSANVQRAVMSPSIPKKSNMTLRDNARQQQVMKTILEDVSKNYEYVGDAFADEARAIYYGDREDRDIYGETTLEEAKALIDEGVPVAPLPILPPNVKN